MSAQLIGWNEWFAERSSGHETTKAPIRPKDDDRPRYERGSGLRITICHKEHDDAAYLRQMNRASGNEVLEDEKGFLYTLVCRY